MIFDLIDSANPDELAGRLYRLLRSDMDDRATHAALRDRRLLPALTALVIVQGRPPSSPQGPLDAQAERVTEAAIFLLGEIAGSQDREVVQALLGALEHPSDRVKLAAATALGQIGASEAATKVLAFAQRMMEQRQIGAVSRLAKALGKIGGEEARTGLAQFVDRNRESADKHVQHVVAEVESALRSITERLA